MAAVPKRSRLKDQSINLPSGNTLTPLMFYNHIHIHIHQSRAPRDQSAWATTNHLAGHIVGDQNSE
jgi:hypothetical protein